ncbi:hypothetical protein OSTOST_20836, partial [Ostertagia ostertagi]
SNRQRFLDQEVLLSELNYEVKSLARDKDILQERCIELERKYKKAKAASKEFEKLIEAADPCSSNAPDSPSLLDRSRRKHRSPSKKDEQNDSLQICLENSQIEIEDLRSRLEKEVNMSKSLHDDLDQSRKLTRADCLSYALENQRLIEEAREASQQIVSYRAKLEAQGADLIATKKTLRALQRDKDSTVSQNNTGTSTVDEK